MARKKTLHDDDGVILYPNTITDCVYNPDGTTLTDTLGKVDISNIGDGTITGAILAVNQKRNELFQYVSDGKYLVANAITDKGVNTEIDAQFATMRDNIRKLKYRVTNTWTSETPIPYNFSHGCAVEYNHELHIFGGNNNSTNHYKYDGYIWTKVSDIPYEFKIGCAIVLNNEIHILGGDTTGTNHYKYDGLSWISVSTLPFDFNCKKSAVVYNNEIHIIGNRVSNGNYTGYHYKYNGSAWVQVSTLPYIPIDDYTSTIVYDNELHILGGSIDVNGNIVNYNNHYKYNGSAWVQVSTLPINNETHAIFYNNRIHLIVPNVSIYIAGHYVYDFTECEWYTLGNLPYVFNNGSIVTYKDDLRILGGDITMDGIIRELECNYFYFEDLKSKNLPNLQTKFVRLSNSLRDYTVFPDDNYDALSQVAVSVFCQEKTIDTKTLLDNNTVEVIPDDDALLSCVKINGPELISPSIDKLSSSNPEFIIQQGYHTGNGSVNIECYTKNININHGLLEVTPENDKTLVGVNIIGPTNIGEYIDTLSVEHESITIPEGYHNGDGYIQIESEDRDVTIITGSKTVSASEGKVISSVNVTGPTKAPANQISNDIITNDSNVYINFPSAGYYTTSDTITTSISKFGNNALTINNAPYKNDLNLVSGLCNDRGIYSNTETFIDLPYSMKNGAAVVFRNHIHILGGGTQHYKLADDGLWEICESIPYEFASGSAVVYNDEIHILGTDEYKYGDDLYTRHYKYDGTTWTRLSDLPYDFADGAALVFNGQLHILGTGLGSNDLNHYAWNGSSWSKISTLPIHFYGGSATVYNNEIHILGGSGAKTSHYKYSSSTNQWESVSTLPYEFTYGVAVTYNDEIHILGSYTSNSDSDGETWERNHYKWDGVMWTKVSTLPNDFCDNPALVFNNSIYVFGYANYDTMKGRCIIHFESILQKLLVNTITSVNDNTKLLVSV